MPIDPNIALSYRPPQFESPVNQMTNVLQMQNAQQSNQLNALGLQERQRAVEDNNRLRDLYAQPDFDPTTPDGLKRIRQVVPAHADAMQKAQLELRKLQGDIDKNAFDTASRRFGAYKQTIGSLSKAPNLTRDMVVRAGQQMVQMGVMPQSMFDDGIADLPEDPVQLRAALEDDLRTQLTPEQMFTIFTPKVSTVDNGQQVFRVDDNPNSRTFGQRIGAPAVQKMQSPESVASQATTRRGQDMTDARARELNASQGNTYDPERGVVVNTRSQTATPVTLGGQPLKAKPLPASALKMQQESLDAIGVASSINADLGGIAQQITDGKLKFGPLSNAFNAGRNAAGMSSEESRNFASFKSSLERLRNESLRLNTGVQTDGDAQRAWNELFQNINDTDLVSQRLAEIQGINKRGAELHRLRIDSVRGNYGADPLDSSAYSNQPAAVGGAQVAPAQRNGGFKYLGTEAK